MNLNTFMMFAVTRSNLFRQFADLNEITRRPTDKILFTTRMDSHEKSWPVRLSHEAERLRNKAFQPEDVALYFEGLITRFMCCSAP